MTMFFLIVLSISRQSIAANEIDYCQRDWWITAKPSDFDKPIENVNRICDEREQTGIIHVALQVRNLNPESFFNFLLINFDTLNLQAVDGAGTSALHFNFIQSLSIPFYRQDLIQM